MTGASGSLPPAALSWKAPEVPSPDTPEGRVLVYALIVAVVYILLLIVGNVALANQAASFLQLPLILGTIASFAIGGLIGADYARARQFELELARTVSVHSASGQPPEPNSPLGGVLKEYARASLEHRQHARSHAYAAGPAIWGTLVALAAIVAWGVGVGTGAGWLTYLALVIELPALVLLVLAVSILGTTVGLHRDIPGFDVLTPSRWRRFHESVPGVDEAIATCPWLNEYLTELRRSSALTTGLPSASAQG